MLTLLTKILWSLYICSSQDEINAHLIVELIGWKVSSFFPDAGYLNKHVSVEAFCGHGCFPIYQGAFQSFCPVKKKSPSQMRREEARKNKYCLNKSNLVYVEETEDKKSSDKKSIWTNKSSIWKMWRI